ncbi:MAG: sodium:solute symporter family protein [Oscillospiraceae bacterium]|nr:sodium:solute symporter family protein [Oscillospiraceae bacterium]
MADFQLEIRTIPLIIVCVYVLAMMAFGVIIGKYFIKDSKDYMLAGRRMGLLTLGISLSAVNVGGGSTMGVATRAYGAWGLSALWWVLAASIAMIPISYFAPEIRRTFSYTIPMVINKRFGSVAGTSSAVLGVVSLFLLTSSQIVASATVITALIGTPWVISVFVSTFVILFYTCLGGMTADIYSDMFQFSVLFLGMLVAVPFIINGVGGWDAMVAALPEGQMDFTRIGWFMIISLIINYFTTFLAGPEMMSRVFSAKDERNARKACVVSAIVMCGMGVLPTVIGLAALAAGAPDGGGALIWATDTFAPQVVVGFMAAAILAATMSSADSNLINSSTIFIKDIYQRFINPAPMSEKKLVLTTRMSNVVLGLMAMCIALFRVDIITMNMFAFAMRSAGPFAAFVLGVTWKKATPHAGLVAIIVGSAAAVIWELIGTPLGIMAVVFGAACSTLSFVAVTLIESKMGVAPAPSPEITEGK